MANGGQKDADDVVPLNRPAEDDLYNPNRYAGFETVLQDVEEDTDKGPSSRGLHPATLAGRTSSAADRFVQDMAELGGGDDEDLLRRGRAEFSGLNKQKIVERESDYHKRRLTAHHGGLSPGRGNVYDDQTPARGYGAVLQQSQLDLEKRQIELQLEKRRKEAEEAAKAAALSMQQDAAGDAKKRRWDQAGGGGGGGGWDIADATPAMLPSVDQTPGATPAGRGRWDVETPGRAASDATPSAARRNRWGVGPADATPGSGIMDGVTPTPGRSKKARWDQTPVSGEIGRAHV